jgi:hypothetical protein
VTNVSQLRLIENFWMVLKWSKSYQAKNVDSLIAQINSYWNRAHPKVNEGVEGKSVYESDAMRNYKETTSKMHIMIVDKKK